MCWIASEAQSCASVQPIYLNGEYLVRNPLWHLEESEWKAVQIARMLQRNQISPTTVCDVGCGAGEVLPQFQKALTNDCTLYGYDVSPQAIDLALCRANERLHFCVGNFCGVDGAWFDLLLALDVFEHVEDYYGFLRQLGDTLGQRLLRLPRKLCFALHNELTVRILGGYSLLVLAR